jgi:hypothetical protein
MYNPNACMHVLLAMRFEVAMNLERRAARL